MNNIINTILVAVPSAVVLMLLYWVLKPVWDEKNEKRRPW